MLAQNTPLFEVHQALNAKMADFAGWNMPLWYEGGQVAEHHATRKACGLFDICHMGEFEIKGRDALPFLQKMVTNDLYKISDGQASYNFMLNEQGGVIDDCIVYRFHETAWMMVVNAGNIEIDFNWLKQHAPDSLELNNVSDKTGKIDVQGPNAPRILAQWIDAERLGDLKFFRFLPNVQIEDMDVLVSRTGYTGEMGFELYVRSDDVVKLWNLLLKCGEAHGLVPCGLGARDTLRTEAGLPLHGHELTPHCVSAGHPWMFAVNMNHDFTGKEAVAEALAAGNHDYVYPFRLEGRRKAMPGWNVLREDAVIGTVISGVMAPSLENAPIGFLRVNQALETGSSLVFQQPGRPAQLTGQVAASPFVAGTARKKIRSFL